MSIRSEYKPGWLTMLAQAKNNGGLARKDYNNPKSPGFGMAAPSHRLALRNRGCLDDEDRMTEKGYQVLAQAREEGF